MPRKAGPFLKAGFGLFLTLLIPRSEEAKQTNAPVLDFFGTLEDFGQVEGLVPDVFPVGKMVIRGTM